MPQRAFQRKLGKKPVTKPIQTKGEASVIDKRERLSAEESKRTAIEQKAEY
jgi:hypothetical protein